MYSELDIKAECHSVHSFDARLSSMFGWKGTHMICSICQERTEANINNIGDGGLFAVFDEMSQPSLYTLHSLHMQDVYKMSSN